MTLAELMDIGDIEKFFNENFFKKIHRGNRNKAQTVQGQNNFMHGVPESAYEPTVMDDSKKEVKKLQVKLRSNLIANSCNHTENEFESIVELFAHILLHFPIEYNSVRQK